MSRIDTKSLIEMCVPGLGDGDKSECLDDWLGSFLKWAEAKEERMFSPLMINALFHTFAGGKVRVERLVAERNHFDRALHFAAGKLSTFLDPDEDHSEDIYNQFLKEVKIDD